MSVGIVFTDGKCNEAIEYYCDIFEIDKPDNIIKYCEFEKYNYPDNLKNRIYNSHIDIYGNRIFLHDATVDGVIEKGNNIRIVIETSSDNLYKAYMNFRKDSTITMEPQKVNKKLFTTLIDKYDISWQFVAEST